MEQEVERFVNDLFNNVPLNLALGINKTRS